MATTESKHAQERHLQTERFNKIRAYLIAVAGPVSQRFLEPSAPYYDPEASVLVAGSSASDNVNGKTLRVGSDFDLMVVSERLKDPNAYFSFLRELHSFNHIFMEDTGIVPLAFTEVAREEEIRFIGMREMQSTMKRQSGRETGDHFLPLHLLYYHSYPNYFRREPDRLATRLLQASVPLVGEKQFINIDPSDDLYPRGLDMARWMIERTSAELALNINTMPPEYLLRKYKNSMLSAVRAPLMDTVYRDATQADAQYVLANLDRDYPEVTGGGLLDSFSHILEIHRHDRPKNGCTVHDLIDPAYRLMGLIDHLASLGYNGNGKSHK